MSKKKIERLEIRLNSSNPLDALLLAKLETIAISAPALAKNLLLNYFAGQPGGIGLVAQEQSLFAEMQPRSAKAKKEAQPKATKPVSAAPVSRPAEQPASSGRPAKAVDVDGSGWGPGKLPPCFDTSEL